QPLPVFSQKRFFPAGGDAAMRRPPLGNADTEVGVQPGEQPLAQPASEEFFKYFIFPVAGAKSVAVVQVKGFATPLDDEFVVDDGSPQLAFQVTEHPHVVVAFKKGDFYARIGEVGQLAQKPDVAFGNHRGVFKPKIKYVAHQVQFGGIILDFVEPGDDTSLSLRRGGTRMRRRMEIGSEVNLVAYRHAAKLR